MSNNVGQYLLSSYYVLLNMPGLGGTPGSSVSKESACSAGDLGSIHGSGRPSGEGNDNPLQYPYLENPLDRGAWWAAVRGLAKIRA